VSSRNRQAIDYKCTHASTRHGKLLRWSRSGVLVTSFDELSYKTLTDRLTVPGGCGTSVDWRARPATNGECCAGRDHFPGSSQIRRTVSFSGQASHAGLCGRCRIHRFSPDSHLSAASQTHSRSEPGSGGAAALARSL